MQRSKSEHRSFERVAFRRAVGYQVDPAGQTEGSLSGDLSEGGMKITLNRFVPLHSEIKLSVNLEEGAGPSTLTGRVVWVKYLAYSEQYQVGIKFDSLDIEENQRERIRGCVAAEQN